MNTKGEVAGLLLAAGGGRRLGGRPKALLPYEGRPLVEHAVRVLRDGGCGPVHVVLGAAADEVVAAADLSGCVVVRNPRWEEGMGSSLRAGLASLAAAGPAPAAALIGLVDQPGVGAAAVARVLAAAGGGEALVSALAAAVYDGRRGHPVLIGGARWAGVAGSAAGDRGARTYLREHAEQTVLVECGDIGDPADIDTPADLRLLRPAEDRSEPGGGTPSAPGATKR
ncbi:nicotine blue oxidoreductase [Actinacidiphila alni]|uniref:Nicotine blue oxidoreductase n=1 Tax=Actinacidiphila alni TaxID=380248 RepID=A0A1I1X1B2_9ACTN|nr:NTP transferase domain-containing protein [Actinacidiphila alni]SFD99140.1 nicotine blue oxidoreductase [Actinacidiphila alni]